jgi:hypothetical protein
VALLASGHLPDPSDLVMILVVPLVLLLGDLVLTARAAFGRAPSRRGSIFCLGWTVPQIAGFGFLASILAEQPADESINFRMLMLIALGLVAWLATLGGLALRALMRSPQRAAPQD